LKSERRTIPSDNARVEGVFLLDHSFEILLQAVVFEKTSRIRNRRESYNYGFEKCLNICQSQLSLVDAVHPPAIRVGTGQAEEVQVGFARQHRPRVRSHPQWVQAGARVLRRTHPRRLDGNQHVPLY
jgi:hypothetical protein